MQDNKTLNNYTVEEIKLLCDMLEENAPRNSLQYRMANKLRFHEYDLEKTFDSFLWTRECINIVGDVPFNELPLWLNHPTGRVIVIWRLLIEK